MKPQSIFKKEAIAKEFPFVQDVLDKIGTDLNKIDRIEVKRLDRSFLFSVPSDELFDGSLGSDGDTDRLFGVWEKREGWQVAEIGLTPYYRRRSNYAYSSPEERDGDTYLSAIYGGAEDALFFVHFNESWDTWQGHESYYDKTITILKPPKGFTVWDCIAEAQRAAAAEVVKEVDATEDINSSEYCTISTHRWMPARAKMDILAIHPQAIDFQYEAGIESTQTGCWPYFSTQFMDGKDILEARYIDGKIAVNYCGTVE